MRPIIVYDGAQPRIRLLSWFLNEAGHRVTRAPDETAALAALAGHPESAVILNSLDAETAIRSVVTTLCEQDGDVLIVALRSGKHEPGERPLGATVCVHHILEAQTAVSEIERILRSDASPTD